MGVEARPQGDHAGHSGGVAGGQRLGEVATAAVAKEGDRSATLAMDQLEALVESVEGAVGAVDVEADPRAARNVADAPEPAREHPERLLSGEEAGDEDHVRSVAGAARQPRGRSGRRAGGPTPPASAARARGSPTSGARTRSLPPAGAGRSRCARRDRPRAALAGARRSWFSAGKVTAARGRANRSRARRWERGRVGRNAGCAGASARALDELRAAVLDDADHGRTS